MYYNNIIPLCEYVIWGFHQMEHYYYLTNISNIYVTQNETDYYMSDVRATIHF